MAEEIARITCEELRIVMDGTGSVVVVDARSRRSYSREHIPGAVNIPYDAAADPMERSMMLASLPGDRLTVIYCD
jgi:rhodanese-related sulfurtransferase